MYIIWSRRGLDKRRLGDAFAFAFAFAEQLLVLHVLGDRRLAEEATPEPQRDATRELVADLDLRQLLQREMRRIADQARTVGSTGGAPRHAGTSADTSAPS